MPSPASSVATALNRFGLGARPDATAPVSPRRWLMDQFDHYVALPPALAGLPDAGVLVKGWLMEQRAIRELAMAAPRPAGVAPGQSAARMAARRSFVQDVQALYRQGVQARVQVALDTPAPFVERLVYFWSNHFCLSADNPQVAAFAAAFERDAIRPHVLGRFADMLSAVEHHPGMLIYLNQVQSIGPGSPAARRAAVRNPDRRAGLNENLAREIMELHTLGVRSGYTQQDVTEFARSLTGWTVDGVGPGGRVDDGNPDDFIFRPQLHEPGARTIMGRRYAQPGEGQARAALADFARARQPATHVATKLARHFAGDDPPPALAARLADTFERSDGDLPSVYRTLIDSPEPWSAPPKFKSPWDWIISAQRGMGAQQTGQMQLAPMLAQLGQPVWRPGSPAGWDDSTAAWAAPDALLRRVELAARLAAAVADRFDARALLPRLLPAASDPHTAAEIGRAESPAAALALLLVSPDFLRR